MIKEIKAVDTAKYDLGLFESIFDLEPNFVVTALKPFDSFMDQEIPGIKNQRVILERLKWFNLIDGYGNFNSFAVNSGFAVQACSKSDLTPALMIQKDWYITLQGQLFINELNEEIKQWQ